MAGKQEDKGGRLASSGDRAATPSEPSPSVSGKAGIPEGLGASSADAADRATDAPHEAADASSPFGSVSTGAGDVLLPCPFCGSPGTMIHPMGNWSPGGYGPNGSRIVCTDAACPTMSRACFGENQDAEAIAAWNTRPSGWQPIETAPHACHVLATRFDVGEWVAAVVLSPPIQPFTHWQMLPEPPAQAIEARRAATAQTGAVEDESAVGNADAPNPSSHSSRTHNG